MRTTRMTRLLAALLASTLLLAACGDGDDDADTADGDEAADGQDAPDDGEAAEVEDGPTIVLRGQDFSESVTITEVYGQYLEGLGFDVEIPTPAGFRDEAIADIESGELNMIVDYIGGSSTALAPEADTSDDPNEVMEIIEPAYAEIGATVLDHAEAVNGDAFVVRGDEPEETISEVADADYVLGAAAQCFERTQCFIGFEEVYGIDFADTVTIEFGPLLGEALAAEEVDAVVWNDTAPQIETEGFKVLEDDQGIFPAQNIAPIVRDDLLDAYGDTLIDAIDDLTAQITTDDLLEWNIETDIEFRESDDVAAEWLEANGLR